MAVVFMWPVRNANGEDLLERHVRPLSRRLGFELSTPSASDDRSRLLQAIQSCQAVVCDCSVEEGHIYHNFLEAVKVSNHVLLCSRTPLPRNVFAFHELAPHHGETLSNEELAGWLGAVIPAVLAGADGAPSYFGRMSASLNAARDRISLRTGIFVSYRGRIFEKASRKAAEVAARVGVPARVVPKGEFVYETECLTRQQTWSVVARMEREIQAARGFMVIRSFDYFDSFWTTSELLIALLFRRQDDGTIGGGLVVDERELDRPGPVAGANFDVPPATSAVRDEYCRLMRQGDPGTVAPELRRGTSGVFGRLFGALSQVTGHADSPSGDWWWSEVLVPCPKCRPVGKTADELSWERHLGFEGYGYFPLDRRELEGKAEASVRCPRCGGPSHLISRREPRTLWVPGPLGRPWPPEMQMIEYEPVWEIL